MNQIAGGATAESFVTYYNGLKRNLLLNISAELPLKQLVIGRVNKVFEIGRVFGTKTSTWHTTRRSPVVSSVRQMRVTMT